MATGKEALGSMGADNPIAVLSDRPNNYPIILNSYLLKLQPPIDPIRERIVMDLRTMLEVLEIF